MTANGTYATNTSVLISFPVFPQTSTVSRYTETVSLIDEKIPQAEAEINASITRRYTTPFAAGAVPPEINRICVNLAGFYTLMAKFSADGHNVNAWVLEIGKECKESLKAIRDRQVDLVNTAGALVSERTSSTKIDSTTEDYQPFADLDDIENWAIDSDRLTEISDAR